MTDNYKIAIDRIKTAKKNGSMSLDLSGLDLTELPSEIGLVKNLFLLNLSKNNLTSICPEISNLKFLQKLDLRYNRLFSIPDEIGQLT